MTIVEQIHAEFDTSIENLEKALLSGHDAIMGVIPSDLFVDEFKGLIGHYKFHYPQNTFITEKQLAAICLKYGLVTGGMIAFEDAIPLKNKQEIQAFALNIKDREKPNFGSINDGYKVRDFIHRQFFMGLSMMRSSFSMSSDPGERQTAEIEMRVLEDGKKFFVLLGDTLGFTVEFDGRTITGCKLFMEWEENGIYQIYEAPFDARHAIIYADYKREIGWDFERFPTMAWGSEDAIASFPTRSIQRTLNLKVDAMRLLHGFESLWYIAEGNSSSIRTLKVVAPLDKFNQNTFTVKDGYKLRLDYNNWLKESAKVDDPIVLQPVKGGYLVVTKWGEESKIPEMQNGKSN